MLYRFLVIVVGTFLKIVFRIEFIGQENVPQDRGYILVSNHRSGYDPLFLVIGMKPQVHFMAKEELMKLPLLGWLLANAGVFGVSRGTGDTGAVDTAVHYLKTGQVVGIFPEGTRAPLGTTLRPKSGVAHIARMSGAGVLPCCVSIDGRCRIGARVRVRYGQYIPNEQLGLDEGVAAGLRSATRVMWNQGVLPLLEELEGPAKQ